MLRNKKSSLYEEYKPFLSKEKELRAVVEELTNQMRALDKEISQVEKDMMYKKEEVALEKLKKLEDQYRKNNKVRDEQALVNQIDKMKRNIRKFQKYNPLVEQLTGVKEELNSQYKKLREVRATLRSIQAKISECKQQLASFLRTYNENRNMLRQLYEHKRAAIEKYQNSRTTYLDWRNAKRSYDQLMGYSTSSCPVKSFDNVDEFEPFYEQKQTCVRLINYFQSLLNRMDGAEHKEASNEGSDSADELPESFEKLKIGNRKSMEGVAAVPKPKTLRFRKRGAQNVPLSHSMDVIRMLSVTDTQVPITIAEVPTALAQVEKLLEHYSSQTNVIDWSAMDFEQSHTPSVSMSLASVTGSDIDSPFLSGSNLPR
ncbi:hypothetical protein L596_015047 [Steinernema carpocapsae]|uniref:Uncharacterized protein n=1 Tax=Steinernema carpocapsae TaxID=34508 RepID=A0A4U5NEQ8_STECR|nr:hypothetical protein L596_015047 [Steinernema carpocapsae]